MRYISEEDIKKVIDQIKNADTYMMNQIEKNRRENLLNQVYRELIYVVKLKDKTYISSC